jgi:hypothetical protein
MTHGLEAMGRLGGIAAQAGQSLGAAFSEPVAQATRAAAENSTRYGARASARPNGRR